MTPTVNTLKKISLLICVCLATLTATAKETTAKVFNARGNAQFLLPEAEEWQPLKRGLDLPVGTRVYTGKDGLAVLRLTNGSAIRVSRNSNLVLRVMEEKKDGDKIRIKLDKGSMSNLIDEGDREDTDFKIETPQGTAAARGTFYAVGIQDGKTYIQVKEGEVDVLRKVLK